MPKLRGNPYYCRLNKPSDEVKRGKMVFKPAYSVQLALSDKEQVKKAKELGIKIQPADDNIPNPFIKFSSYVTSEEHKEFKNSHPNGRRPVIYDAKGKLLEAAPVMSEESDVAVIFDLADYDGQKKPLMRAVQVFKSVLPEDWEENTGSIVQEADLDSELEVDDSEEGLNDSLDDI